MREGRDDRCELYISIGIYVHGLRLCYLRPACTEVEQYVAVVRSANAMLAYKPNTSK